MKHFINCLILFCCGCANITPLTGGDKDTKAPTLIHVSPPNQSVQFDGNEIIMEFDETIIINSSQEIILSPYIDNSIESKANKNKLILKIDAPLEENTTYLLELNNYVKDITEGNEVQDLNYTFSSGSQIDTLYIRGSINDAISSQIVKNVIVCLYPFENKTDSLLYKVRPYYLTKSNEEGKFSFSNLPNKAFKLFALEDLDNNFLFSLPQERVGFVSDALKPNLENMNVMLFDETHQHDSIMPLQSDSSNTDFGRLRVDSLPNQPLIAQLLKNEKVMYESRITNPLIMDSLLAGSYSLRIIVDENENGQWDSGHLLSERLPEKVSYFSETISIRNNWDINLIWETNE